MAETLIDILERLNVRIKALAAENVRLRNDNEALQERNNELIKLREEADERRHRAELDAEYLAVSHRLAEDPDTLLAARRHISRLIRNIDRCLEMLKE